MKKNNQQDEQSLENTPPRKQIIPEKGEEYLREVANIEDMPSPAEDAEAEKALRNPDKTLRDEQENDIFRK